MGDCTIYVAKTKALISCAVTAQLICAFGFAYAKRRFSHDAARFITGFTYSRINSNNVLLPRNIHDIFKKKNVKMVTIALTPAP